MSHLCMISLPRPCDNIFKYSAVTVNYINKYIYNIKNANLNKEYKLVQ